MVGYVASSDQTACLRVHSASEPGAALGRFHRRDRGAKDGLARRITGGRSTATGPGLLEMTLAVPSIGWLDPGGVALRPEQFLNRALRPLLATLRRFGVDAFYPGRDLITVASKPVAACSFSVFPDAVVVVEVCVGATESLSTLGERLADLDPNGVAAVDTRCFEEAVSLAELDCADRTPEQWLCDLATTAQSSWRCTTNICREVPPWLMGFIPPTDSAYAAFLEERLPAADDVRTAASMSMLGVVEVSARIEDARVSQLEITGDLIAPPMTLSALTDACEGVVARPAALRRAVTEVLSHEGHFLLGLESPDELLCRLV
jgi:hypothetical protein